MSHRPQRRSTRERRSVVRSDARTDSDESSRASKRRRKEQTLPPQKKRKRRETIGRPRRPNHNGEDSTNLKLGKVPPWPEPAKLPYDVLLNIFRYAAYPLADEDLKANPSVAWLVKVALLRRDFAEPALAALYYNPPVDSSDRAHALLGALRRQNENSTMDYGRKIRYLDINAHNVLCFKYLGLDPPVLADFLALTPMLRGVRINWARDSPTVVAHPPRIPYAKVPSWYGDAVFDLLEKQHIALEHWKWNFIFFGPRFDHFISNLTHIHQRAALRKLKMLELRQIFPDRQALIFLSNALGVLQALETLIISNPFRLTFSDTIVLFQHVKPLLSLSLLGCNHLTSEALSSVLATHGSHLQHLILNHNRRLDLAFLGNLETQCPRLESISMDLTFHSTLGSVRVAAPEYEALLPEDCTPTWPRTLKSIRLVHLRKWNAESATRFFESLVNSAAKLTDLRWLEIRMSVDVDWRDRISFRDKWEARVPGVFRRPWVEPLSWSVKATKRAERWRAEAAAEPTDDDHSAAIQGRCDRVDIRIENLRPMDRQLDESNFLDSEPSGDEDYLD